MGTRENELASAATVAWIKSFSQIAGKSHQLLNNLLQKHIPPVSLSQITCFSQLFQQFLQQGPSSPKQCVDLQLQYWQELYFIWQRFILLARELPSVEKRADQFSADFVFIKDYYLLHIKHLDVLLKQAQGLEKKTVQEIQFYLNPLLEALSPTGLALTSPQVWQAILETLGSNLLHKLNNALSETLDPLPC